MKLTKIAIIAAMALGVFNAQASDVPQLDQTFIGGQGEIKFTGSVVDAPCNITHESLDQSVRFGLLSKSLLNKGEEAKKEFAIKLEQCEPSIAKQVEIKFSGLHNDASELSMQGGAKNVAVRLEGMNGENIILGQKTTATNLGANTNELHFFAYAKKAKDSKGEVTEGDFSGMTNFLMSYK
ncbi:fimbrial protein [Xenorhabdus lircayensis]|uniref:Type 1 fimbrial protein n=1 Tax=Xenorhabdus lircayensis TaxID=2763499 RepID=A0ABS0U8Q3_9GAMM|nr:fimbrial protein [Xenorhabdus lircayensis]MBI6550261.1 type 1 fimbrial protein [Xenorhabdus lircayensis]